MAVRTPQPGDEEGIGRVYEDPGRADATFWQRHNALKKRKGSRDPTERDSKRQTGPLQWASWSVGQGASRERASPTES